MSWTHLALCGMSLCLLLLLRSPNLTEFKHAGCQSLTMSEFNTVLSMSLRLFQFCSSPCNPAASTSTSWGHNGDRQVSSRVAKLVFDSSMTMWFPTWQDKGPFGNSIVAGAIGDDLILRHFAIDAARLTTGYAEDICQNVSSSIEKYTKPVEG